MNECSVAELRDHLSSNKCLLIDVREPMEYAGARVAGARLIPLGEIGARAGEIDREKPILVMCRTGRRSAEAQRKLASMGYENVTNVSGGIEAWKKEAFPVERDEHAPWSIERQVRFTAGLIVLAGVLLSIFVHPYFIAVSGLIGLGLTVSAATDWCGMGMVLARMPWNRRAV